MSATPGARSEYSRGSGRSGGGFDGENGSSNGGSGKRIALFDRGADGLILIGALLAALLLIGAEVTTLYQVHVAGNPFPVRSVGTGSNHSYAMIPLAVLAAALGLAVWRFASRPALLAVGVLGVVALLIALVNDLPDSHATGLAGSPSAGYLNASATPSAGLYMETLGAVLLIATCGLGFMMLGPPVPRRRSRRGPGPGSGPGRSGPAGDRPEEGRGLELRRRSPE